MVRASIPQSVSGIGEMFQSRDIKGIAIVGGLAATGVALSVTVSALVNDFLGTVNMSRAGMLVLALSASLVAMGAMRLFSRKVGGAMALGSVVVVGIAIVNMVLGPQSDLPPNSFRQVAHDDGFAREISQTAPGISMSQGVSDRPPQLDREDGFRDIGPGSAAAGGAIR